MGRKDQQGFCTALLLLTPSKKNSGMDIQTEAQPQYHMQPEQKSGHLFYHIISYLFHPVFMPAAMTVLLYYYNKAEFISINNTTPFWFGIILVNSIAFPLLLTFLLRKLNFIKSIRMEDAKDRIIPLIGTMIFYFWAYQVFKSIQAPFLMRNLLLGCFWGIIAVFIVNIFFKISMHTAAAGGAAGFGMLMVLYQQNDLLLPFMIILLAAGLVGTARMKLGAHIGLEIWLGYITGIAAQLAAYVYLT